MLLLKKYFYKKLMRFFSNFKQKRKVIQIQCVTSVHIFSMKISLNNIKISSNLMCRRYFMWC